MENLGGIGFLNALDKNGDGVLTLEEALEYYDEMGSTVQDDKRFESMIQWTFRIEKKKHLDKLSEE